MVVHGIVVGADDDDDLRLQAVQIRFGDHRPDLPLDAHPPHRDSVLLPHGYPNTGIVEGRRNEIDGEVRRFDRAAMMDDPIKVLVGLDGVDLFHGLGKLVREFDAAFGATAGDAFPSAGGSHTSAETALVSVFFLRGLISFLAHNEVLLCF